jgi:hypothetical protein
MDEKRDYENNGLGRRDYDKIPCPFYDIEEHKCKEVEAVKIELKSKMSWSIFALFVTSMIVLGGIYLNHEMSKSNKTLDIMIELKEKTSSIDAKQELIIHHLKSEEKESESFPFE